MTSLFISYARKDGRELALRLQGDLRQAGYEVWLDTAEIEGGASWSTEIERAIDNAAVTLALLSNASFVSEVCRAEQLRSLRKGKRVIPLLVEPDAERPLHLEQLNYRDFSDPARYTQTLLILLEDIASDKAAPMQARAFVTNADPLPDHYIPRPEAMEQLRQAVMTDNTDRRTALTALHGLGGIGKSVLASALCRDEVVQDAFPDGVIWIKVGRKSGDLTEQIKLVGTRLGDSPTSYSSEQAGIDRLRMLLPGKSALIVLDDVWDAKHVEPFVVDAPRCRVLFTTRDANIALTSRTKANVVTLGTLTPQQALALLRERAEGDDPAFPQIAEKLGYHPLALSLAGGRIVQGMTGAEWLAAYQHVSDMKSRRRTTDPHESLELCFDLSVSTLREDSALYYAFGIFPDDVWIPQSVVIRLWRQLQHELTEDECRDLINELARLALIERHASDKTIALHDLLHDYTRAHLGNNVVEAHEALLDSYRHTGKLWYQMDSDGYFYEHLAYHLDQAGHQDELYKLLTDSPDWMDAKFIACVGDTSTVNDLALAGRDLADPLQPDRVIRLIALSTAKRVIHARVGLYTDTSLETLVWLGREREAVAHAGLRVDTGTRFDGLMTIYRTSRKRGNEPTVTIGELLNHLRNIEVAERRAYALRAIMIALTEEDLRSAKSALSEALKIASNIEDAFWRAYALRAIGMALSQATDSRAEVVFGQAVQAAHDVESTFSRAEAMRIVALAMDEVGDTRAGGTLNQALETAHTIESLDSRATALRNIAAALAQIGQFDEALQIAWGLDSADRRAYALRFIAAALAQAGDQRVEATFDQALQAAYHIEAIYSRTTALRDLAAALAKAGQFTQALEIARSLETAYSRANALRDVAAALGEASDNRAEVTFSQALEAAHEIETAFSRAEALSAIALAMIQASDNRAEVTFSQALDTARDIEPASSCATLLRDVAVILARTGDSRAEATLNEALAIVQNIEDADGCVAALRAIAVALVQMNDGSAEAIFSLALETAYTIEATPSRVAALRDIAASLAQIGRFSQALEIAQSIEAAHSRVAALRDIAAALARTGQVNQALEIAQSIEPTDSRLEVVQDTVAVLIQTSQFSQALEAVGSIEAPASRAHALSAIATGLAQSGDGRAETTFAQALETAHSIGAVDSRAYALSAIAAGLAQSGDGRAEATFAQALETAHSIGAVDSRAYALSAIAAGLTQSGDGRAEATFAQALETTRSIRTVNSRATALRTIAASLARANHTNQAFEVAKSIETPDNRAYALSVVAAALAQAGEGRAEAIFAQALEIARTIKAADSRNGTLGVLAAAMSQASQFGQALETAHGIEKPDRRDAALGVLVASLTQAMQVSQALKTTQSIASPDRRDTALRDVAAALAQEGRLFTAIDVLGVRKPEVFLQELARYAPSIEQIKTGGAVEALHEAARIIGWVHPSWKHVADLLL